MEQSEAKKELSGAVPPGWEPGDSGEAEAFSVEEILPPGFVEADSDSKPVIHETRPAPRPPAPVARSEEETDPKAVVPPPRSPFDSSDPRFFLPEAPAPLPSEEKPKRTSGEVDHGALKLEAEEQARAAREAKEAKLAALRAQALSEGATPAPPDLEELSADRSTESGQPASEEGRAVAAPDEEDDGPSENLVARYLDRVCAFCYSRLGTWPLAEEAAEETMVNVLRAEHRWPSGVEEPVVYGWALDIARAVCVDVQRRRAGQSAQEKAAMAIERRGEERTASPPSGSSDRLIRPDLAGNQGVVSYVVRLPEPGRSIVKMRAWDHRTFAEIGKALGRTEGSLASLYAAALKKLDGIVNDPNSRVKPGDLRPDPAAVRPIPELGDEKLLPVNAKSLEESVAAELTPPEGMPSRDFLAQVARRILSNTASVAGTLVGVTGPLDVFSADVSVGGQLRVAGCSPVARRPGDAIYAGELLLSSSTCAAMIRLRSEHLLVVAPGSAAIAGRWDEACRASSATLLAGKMACVGTAEKARMLLAGAPGCKIESGQADWQAVALENGATRVDVAEGTVRVSTIKSEKHGLKKESILASSRQAPVAVQVSTAERTPEWMARLSGSSGLTPGERAALEAMLPGGVSKVMETSGAGAALDKLVELPAKIGLPGLRGGPAKQLAIAGAVVAVVVAGWLGWRWWNGRAPSIEPWMRAMMAGYRKTSSVDTPWPSEGKDHVLAWRSANGSLLELEIDQHRFAASSGKHDKKSAQLAKEDFSREKGNALKLAARAKIWPTTARAVVEEFAQALRAGDAWRASTLAPGISSDFWSDVFKRGSPVKDVELSPNPDNPLAYLATVRYASGEPTKLRLLVQSDAAAAGRPFVDVLASRWN